MTDDKLKKYMEDRFDELITQQSSHHSDNLAQFKEMSMRLLKLELTTARLDSNTSELQKTTGGMQKTITEWKFGGKLAFWIFVAIGSIITWFLRVFGIHIGFKS